MAEVLVLGATSLVGSHFVQSGRFAVTAAGRTHPAALGLRVERFTEVDLHQPEVVRTSVRSAPETVVVNFAARTDVDPVERERSDPASPRGSAWAINALAPESVASACRDSGKFFVQVSTDFVFDGVEGPYDERAARSPFSDRLSWYGWTKSEGERLASRAVSEMAIVRIAFPYRAAFSGKLDFARWMLEKYRQGSLPPLYANQQITPTWVPDVTEALEVLIRRRRSGVFHVASPDVTSPLEFGRELIDRVEGSTPALSAGTLEAPRPGSGIAPRPVRGGLRSRRCEELGIRLTSWRRGIERLAKGEEGSS
jgi:dTDP-4-dehydrorhamnose reductase